METAAEEYARAAKSLRLLEEAAVLLEDASKEQAPESISSEFPARVAGILNTVTAISARDDAERLLAVGGISARYNIDDLSLLKFYTACGQKYATELSDMEMADICFSKAAEFIQPAVSESRKEDADKKTLASATFDLLIGRAECAWEKGESDQAELFVSDASKHMAELPGEHEFLASVEYNFGLFAYQAQETERAFKWLKRSMKTRATPANAMRNHHKQARTARLAGVCLLALQDYEESYQMMRTAEEIAHDPIGAYLLLKLSVITKNTTAADLLIKITEDTDASLDVCMASIALFGDAHRYTDSVIGHERLFARFKQDHAAIIGTIGPSYFETLAAMGCCIGIQMMNKRIAEPEVGSGPDDNNPTESELSIWLSRWSALLLTTGSTHADRKDFLSAAKLLNRCLQFARNSIGQQRAESTANTVTRALPLSKNVVLENEAAVCRLTSSCALCSYDELTKASQLDVAMHPEAGDNDGQVMLRKELLEMSLCHAERAKFLEPTDFAPRLLVFRAYLLSEDFDRAAAEMRVASAEIRSFDPGALAEAACAARDVGSRIAVIAALSCILKMDHSVLCNSLSSSAGDCSKGFFGKVLMTCVHMVLEEEKTPDIEVHSKDQGDQFENGCAGETIHTMLLTSLEHGYTGIQQLGLENAFGSRKEEAHSALGYLTDVCWNKGKECGTAMAFQLWESFFDLCYRYSSSLPPDAENMQTRRMSKVMCASAVIEDPGSKNTDFVRAREHVHEARNLSQMLQEESPRSDEDPIEGLLLILESRCSVGCQDLESLARVAEMAIEMTTLSAAAVEQLAAVCHNYQSHQIASQDRLRCIDLTGALLSKATDIRICNDQRDMEALAVTMREHLGIELSRRGSPSRAFQVFHKASGIVLENSSVFPMDERRWLMAIAWEQGQMYKRLGHNAEARRWCEGARQLAVGCGPLSSYVPRLDAVLGQL